MHEPGAPKATSIDITKMPEQETYGGLGILESNRSALEARVEELAAKVRERKVDNPKGFTDTDEYYEVFMLRKGLISPTTDFDFDRLKMLLKIAVGKFDEERFIRAMENIRTIVRTTAE